MRREPSEYATAAAAVVPARNARPGSLWLQALRGLAMASANIAPGRRKGCSSRRQPPGGLGVGAYSTTRSRLAAKRACAA